MKRADILILTTGLLIVLVIALLVKPMIIGGSNDSLFQDNGTAQAVSQAVSSTPTLEEPLPTPSPYWNGTVYEIGFVDPTPYLQNNTDEQIQMTEFPPRNISNNTMITYAMVHGTGSGATEIFHIPTPYWELRYDVNPYNIEFGHFNVTVMDTTDPSKFVRIVTLGISELAQGKKSTAKWKAENWKEIFYEGQKDYRFVINTQCIRSYTLQIMVPEKYVS